MNGIRSEVIFFRKREYNEQTDGDKQKTTTMKRTAGQRPAMQLRFICIALVSVYAQWTSVQSTVFGLYLYTCRQYLLLFFIFIIDTDSVSARTCALRVDRFSGNVSRARTSIAARHLSPLHFHRTIAVFLSCRFRRSKLSLLSTS